MKLSLQRLHLKRLLALAVLAVLPLLFNNCGSTFVMDENGAIAQSVFPDQYESYGNIPSEQFNTLPTVNTRFSIQALTPQSGLALPPQ